MNGTAHGTVALHSAPEAAAGGPLAPVHDGNPITPDVAERRSHLRVDEAEPAARRAVWTPPEPAAVRGCVEMYFGHMSQANEGADPDFLVGRSGSPVPRDNH